MKWFLKILLGLLITLVALSYWAVQPEKPAASQAWFNGTILTMDDKQPSVEAVFVRDDRIIALGSRADIDALVDAQTSNARSRRRHYAAGIGGCPQSFSRLRHGTVFS